MDLLQKQYETFPYPTPISAWAKFPVMGNLHAHYYTGRALCFGISDFNPNPEIGLFGCGTNEPAAFASFHPSAKIKAFDLSQKSLEKAQKLCSRRKLKNVEFIQKPIESISSEKFDYIHCYGVLHHLRNPEDGFLALSQSLKPEGFARIMVYAKLARVFIQDIQKLLSLLKISPFEINPQVLKRIFSELPKTHRLRRTFESHGENTSPSGLVDAFLNQREKSFMLNEVLEICQKAGLEIVAWDLSARTIEKLEGETGSIIERIQKVESADQWPGQFVFWVRRTGFPHPPRTHLLTNPLYQNMNLQLKFHSPVLRQSIWLGPSERLALFKCRKKTLADEFDKKTVAKLIASRLLLEVTK